MAGLGRGLNSLLSESRKAQNLIQNQIVNTNAETTVSTLVEDNRKSIVDIEIENLKPSIYQPRKSFDDDSIKELAESIKEHGLLEPLLVKKTEDNLYEIICGERRYRACKVADIEKVPCLIRDDLGQDSYAIALIENIQREDLNPIELAQAFDSMLKECNLTQEQLASTLGKSRSSVTNILRLNSFSDDIKQLISSKQLDLGHAKVLLSIDDADTQLKAAQYVIANNLTVRQTEDLVKKIKENGFDEENKTKKASYSNDNFNIWESNISSKLEGIKVKFKASNEEKGKLTLSYSSKEQLEELLKFFSLED